MRVWCDGVLAADPRAPLVRADDHGLSVGDGVFETLKVIDGVPFALTRHLARLADGAARMGLPDPDEDAIHAGIAAVTAAAPPLARLRITMTGGPAPMGSGRGGAAPTLIIALDELAPAAETATLATVAWTRNERSAVAGVKTISFADNVVALAEARRRGAAEAVFANTRGELCEGAGSNIGYVIDGQARTPTLASGCLPGVTRALMLAWCDVAEADAPVGVLAEADEVFAVSTTREIQPVSNVDGRELQAPGPVTAALMAQWASQRDAAGMDP